MSETPLLGSWRSHAQLAAPGIFVLLWATGFLVAKFGLPYALPFTILLIRFALATAMMSAIAFLWRAPWPRDLREWGHIALTGILLQGFYLGGCYAAIAAGIPAGIAALIAGFQPILTAAFAGKYLGEKLRASQWLGTILGFLGLVFVVFPKIGGDGGHLIGLAWAFLSLLGITAATLYQKRFLPRADLRTGAAIQYAAAFFATLPMIGIYGWGEIQWTGEFVFCLFWIVVVLSGISIALLTWMIQRGATAKVASLFYLTPPVAAFGSYLWFGETLGLPALIGMVIVAIGVYLVNRA